jgi:hypothetical protein
MQNLGRDTQAEILTGYLQSTVKVLRKTNKLSPETDR